jgi:hypothetical protein
MWHRRFPLFLLAVIPLAACTGCGPGDPLNRQPVSGAVTLDGASLDRGVIEFSPRDPKAKARGGTLIANGSYEIPRKDGLPPGEYTARIYSATEAVKGDPSQPPGPTAGQPQPVERIPAKYNINSELQVKVTDGGSNQFNFDLTTKSK